MGGLPTDVRTRKANDLLVSDITRDVAEAVRASGVRDGICCLYSKVTTSAVRVSELETGIVDDFTRLITRLLLDFADAVLDEDRGKRGGRDARDTRARCLSMLLGPPGDAIPLANGELRLGTHQRVLLIEFDCGRADDDRGWLAQVIGRRDDRAAGTG